MVSSIQEIQKAFEVLPPELAQRFSTVVTLAKGTLVVMLVYFVVLIILKLSQFIGGWKTNRKLSRIADAVEEINENVKSLIKKSKRDSKK